MPERLGEAVLELSTDNRRLNAGVEDSRQRAQRLSRDFIKYGAIIGGAFLTAGVFAVKAASDTEEAQNKANEVFRESASLVNKFAQDSATSFGISRAKALEYAGTLGIILNQTGLAREETADMSINLVKLAADLASFNNISIDEALNKLRAGLVGEAEPLRTVGVLLNEAAVQTKAMELGFGQAGEALTDQQKVMARYAIILEQTQTQQGDFARTSGSLANQMRILQAEFNDAAAELGVTLIPFAIQAIEALRGLIDWGKNYVYYTRKQIDDVKSIFQGLGDFVAGIFDGIKNAGWDVLDKINEFIYNNGAGAVPPAGMGGFYNTPIPYSNDTTGTPSPSAAPSGSLERGVTIINHFAPGTNREYVEREVVPVIEDMGRRLATKIQVSK